MIRRILDDNLLIERGRAVHGSDILTMCHLPSGIKRHHPGPMRGVDQYELRRRWIAEMERE